MAAKTYLEPVNNPNYSTVAVVPVKSTKPSATSTYPQFDFNTEVQASLARAKAMEAAQATPTVVAPTKSIADQYKDTEVNKPIRTYTSISGDTIDEDTGEIISSRSLAPINQDDIYAQAAQRFQKEIDATNQIYAQKLAQQKETSRGNLGTSTAISARAGALGSPIGEAQYQNVQGQNVAAEDLVRAEQNVAIAGIMGKGRKEAADEIAAKKAAREAGTKDYLAYLKDKQTRKETKLSSLAKQLIANKVDVNTLDPVQLAEIAKNYGVSTNEILSTYKDYKYADDAAQAKLAKEGQFDLSEGQARYDAQGNLIASRNKTYAPKATSGSSYAGGASGGQYANDLDAIIGATVSTIPSKFGQETFNSQLQRTRNDADKINLVAAQVLKGQPAEFKNDFRNQAVGVSNIDKAINEIDSGTKTGVINNAGQYVFNVFGKDFDPKLAKINGYITSAIQPYRNSVTGAAWGEQEDAEYASLFGSTKYSPTELRQRLVQVKEILKAKSAEGLNSFVNPLGYYDNQFASGAYAPSAGDETQQLLDAGYTEEQIQQLINAQ